MQIVSLPHLGPFVEFGVDFKVSRAESRTPAELRNNLRKSSHSCYQFKSMFSAPSRLTITLWVPVLEDPAAGPDINSR
jgi:hypothetical protein